MVGRNWVGDSKERLRECIRMVEKEKGKQLGRDRRRETERDIGKIMP